MTNDTNAANNNIPQVEVDPKSLFDDWTTTQNAPAGNYPLGIDGQEVIFMPITDNTDQTTLDTGSRTPASTLPSHPLTGEMASRSAKRTIPRS